MLFFIVALHDVDGLYGQFMLFWGWVLQSRYQLWLKSDIYYLQYLFACLPLLVLLSKVPHGLVPSLHAAAAPLQFSQTARGGQRGVISDASTDSCHWMNR